MKKKLIRITKVTKFIRVSEILKDMLEDRSDEELMEKYQIGWKQLGKLYGKLFYGGFMQKRDMRRRMELRAGRSSSHIPYVEIKGSASTYKCFACGFTTPLHFSTCPRCRQVNVRRLSRSTLAPASPYQYAGHAAGA
jgi:hypothetical protein